MILGRVNQLLRKELDIDKPFFIDGIDAPIVVKRHTRAKRLTLRLRESRREVALTIPSYCSSEDALSFLEKNKKWLERHLAKLPEFVPFQDGQKIPFKGTLHKINFLGHKRGAAPVLIESEGGEGSTPTLNVVGDDAHAPRRLKDWLKQQAKKEIEQCVKYHANNLKLVPKRISVRDQKSRWGSCSSTGALSFSWRLILAPTHVLDYVAAHEVAHLAEMNHGPRFWKLVRETMPAMDKAQVWLRLHGAGLHRYGDES